MKLYFTIQWKRIGRLIASWGIMPEVGYVMAPVVFVLASWYFFYRVPYAAYLYPALPALLILPLGGVKRNAFLKSTFTRGLFRKIRLLENLLVALPFVAYLCYQQAWLMAAVPFPVVALLSLYNAVYRSRFVLPTPYGRRPFEYPIGFRRLWWIYPLIGLVLYNAVLFENLKLGLFCLLATFLLNMSYFGKPEPEIMVWIHALSPVEFLRKKAQTSLLFGLLSTLPVAGILIAFFPNEFYLVLAAEAIGMLYLVAGVLAKYANFPEQLEVSQMIVLAFCIVVPIGLFVLIPLHYKRAQYKLKPYLQ